tara:strand:- start:842 stop:1210 length:369 start_codon:yes stop_codon:yes gene_type:complete
MEHDMKGNPIPDTKIESDRKFYGVPVVITSTIWESGTHIYEAASPEAALEMYASDTETPLDIDYTGWQDQEYKYDELDDVSGGEVELIPNTQSDIQWILKRDLERKEENERDEREEANREYS